MDPPIPSRDHLLRSGPGKVQRRSQVEAEDPHKEPSGHCQRAVGRPALWPVPAGPGVKLAEYTDSQFAEAVSAFDARFGEMERVLWCLSAESRASLLAGESSPVLEALVWAIKSWWGVQGVRTETKAQMARALARSPTWSPDLFGAPLADRHAVRRARSLARRAFAPGVAGHTAPLPQAGWGERPGDGERLLVRHSHG